jgi:hypothetical protein
MERLRRSPSVVDEETAGSIGRCRHFTLDNLGCILMLRIRSSPQICEARLETATCGDRFASLPISGILQLAEDLEAGMWKYLLFPMESRKCLFRR